MAELDLRCGARDFVDFGVTAFVPVGHLRARVDEVFDILAFMCQCCRDILDARGGRHRILSQVVVWRESLFAFWAFKI